MRNLVSVVVSWCIILCWDSAKVSAFSAAHRAFSSEAYASLGPAIQSVTDWSEGLELAFQFWLPSDPDLPPHFIQPVHHEKRQRWASQLLTQLAKTWNGSSTTSDPQRIVDALARLIQAAAAPHPSAPSDDRLGKEASWILDSLQAIHEIVGRLDQYSNDKFLFSQSPMLLQGIETLIGRAQALGADYPLDQACRVLWAIQGIQAYIPASQGDQDDDAISNGDILKSRVEALPFEIIRQGIDWSLFVPNSHDVCDELLQVIPFRKDTITTRQGTAVTERRGTAWIAAPGIGALAYSGKLMPPQPLPPLVSNVMRKVETLLDLEQSTGFFDCALCNHYADASSACKFHTDPEHGTMWDRTTVVVAAGSSRVFAFKPIETKWEDWDVLLGSNNKNPLSSLGTTTTTTAAATTTLFAGDLVVMRDTCNDDFYHAVHAGLSDDPRISLVLKRAIGPRRGHALAGQGRRHRSNTKRTESSTTNSIASPSKQKQPKPVTPTSKLKRQRQR